MKHFTVFISVCCIAAAFQTVLAISDATPPELIELSIAPQLVDTSSTHQEIIVRTRFADDLSGFAGASGWFQSPASPFTAPQLNVSSFPSMCIAGDPLDGTYMSTLVVPRYSHAGTWRLEGLVVRDVVGNESWFSFSQLRALGVQTEFTVEGEDDREPPEILSACLCPNSVDTSMSNQWIILTVRLCDDLSGMDRDWIAPGNAGAYMRFVSPSRQHSAYTHFGMETRVSGDQYDGIYTNAMLIPRYAETGMWTLDWIDLTDAAGHRLSMTTFDAYSQGLMLEFNVDGTSDMSPPQLRGLEITPRRIDTSNSDQTVLLTVRLADALSGMDSGYYPEALINATFESPSRIHASLWVAPWRRISGDEYDGVYTATTTIPRYSETGIWTLRRLSMTDRAGNNTLMEAADLQQSGFPTQLAVGIEPVLEIRHQANLILLSWPAWGAELSLQSRQHFGEQGSWMPAGLSPIIYGESAIVAVPMVEGGQFYRLAEPP